MCGTPWIDASRARCYNLAFALRHRQPRLASRGVSLRQGNICSPPLRLEPTMLPSRSCCPQLSLALELDVSQPTMSSLSRARHLAFGVALTIGCFAGRCNEYRLGLAGLGSQLSQVAQNPPRVTQGKPPTRFPDCH